VILLRTTSLSPQTAAFARRLTQESGQRVCCVVDERKGEVDTAEFDKIGLTRASCREVGLYCPMDFGWRCGDYGFYLARLRYPEEKFFWLIEYDVRLVGPDAGEFFRNFDGADHVDLIAGHLREAEKWWYWTHTMAARGEAVWRCLFPVVRLSARAIDLLLAQRRAYARKPLRLANWPNDESFVATTLFREGAACADLNDFGAKLYDDTTYTFHQPFDGDLVDDRATPLRIFHPILFGDDLRRKIARMAWIDKGESLPRKVKRRVINALNTRLAA
jgi:hypothetical protein